MSQRELVFKIERAALWAWPPKETASVAGWLLRAGGAARARRIDSAQTLAFAPRTNLDRAVEQVEAWYAARGLPACFQLTSLVQPRELDAMLAVRGYQHLPAVSVFLLEAGAVPPQDGRVELLTRPIPSVMNALCAPDWDQAMRRGRAELFARIRRPHVFGLVTQGGEPAAAGLCVVDGELAGIFAMRTVAPARRRGHGRELLQALVGWARAAGAMQVYLQVEDDNAPANALYRRYEPQRIYGYWYREADL